MQEPTGGRQHLKLVLLLDKSLAPASLPVSPVHFFLVMLCLDGAHVLLTAALEDLLARSLLPDQCVTGCQKLWMVLLSSL